MQVCGEGVEERSARWGWRGMGKCADIYIIFAGPVAIVRRWLEHAIHGCIGREGVEKSARRSAGEDGVAFNIFEIIGHEVHHAVSEWAEVRVGHGVKRIGRCGGCKTKGTSKAGGGGPQLSPERRELFHGDGTGGEGLRYDVA